MTDDSTLATVAGDRGVRIGAALDAHALRTDPSYRKRAKGEFNAVTPENALKMGPLRPSPKEYDFADADAIVNFGAAHNKYVRGHTLVWHNQKPDWFEPWEYTNDQLRTFLRDHVHTVAGRYRTKIDAWDVVNEAIADDGSLRETVWSEAMGKEYLDLAFRWAREVTDADLYYNDYGADAVNEKSDAIYDLLEGMLDRGVPIDGVGLQLHALGEHPDPDSVAENVQRFRDLGLNVQVTEMDVAFLRGDVPEEPLEVQAEYYRDIVEACLEAGCETIVTWGVGDGNSWLRSFKDFAERYTGDPLLFDDRYDPKPAYDAVRGALED